MLKSHQTYQYSEDILLSSGDSHKWMGVEDRSVALKEVDVDSYSVPCQLKQNNISFD